MRRVIPALLLFVGVVTNPSWLAAQTRIYHLHREASTTTGMNQAKVGGPDAAVLAIQSVDLRNVSGPSVMIEEFDTQAMEPNRAGVIPANSTITFSLWMRKTAANGTFKPMGRVRLNNAAGALLCEATSASTLATTVTMFTFFCNTTTAVTTSASDRFYVWVGVNVAAGTNKTTFAEVSIEGVENGNYDSRATVPLAVTVGTITGNITRATGGSPISGATVEALRTGVLQSSTTSDVAGSYSLANIDAGTYDVRVMASGYATSVRAGISVAPLQTTTTNVTLYQVGHLTGNVTQLDGTTPVPNAAVTIYSDAIQSGATSANANGNYSLSGLQPGAYTLEATALGYQPSLSSLTINEGLTTSLNITLTSSTNGSISYVYDEVGRLASVIDAAGNAASYTYDQAGNIVSVTRQGQGSVTISEFTPNGSSVGNPVSIYGTGFSALASQNTVGFNGTGATVTSATVTRLDTTVPPNATSGAITVTSPNGSATSASFFSVTGSTAPTISSVSPPAAIPGTTVTISGTNFQAVANTRVKFNTTYAAVNSVTPTSISVRVPVNAGSGPLSVATPDGTAVTSYDFVIPPPRSDSSEPDNTVANTESVSRMATNTSKTVSVNSPGNIVLVLFDGIAGQRASIQFTSSTLCNGLPLLLRDPRTNRLSYVSGCAGAYADAVTLPQTGTYTMVFDPNFENTGTITFTLHVFNDVTATVTPGGPSVDVATSIPGQDAHIFFDGLAAQNVSLKVTNSSYLNCHVDLFIKQSDGTVLTSDTGCITSSDFLDTVTLRSNGIHSIFLDPEMPRLGGMTLTLYSVEHLLTSITPNGESVTVTTSVPGQNARLTFNGTVGQRVSLKGSTITYPSCALRVYMSNPDGSPLTSNTCMNSNELVDPVTLQFNGTYTILLDPKDASAGSATLNLYDVQDLSGTITPDGSSVTITTTVPGQNARLTFNGTVGQRVSLKGSTITYPSCALRVYMSNPDGSPLTSNTCMNSNELVDPVTLQFNGTYTILLDPLEASTGSATLNLYNVQDLSGTIAPNGASVTVTTSIPGQVARLTFTGTVSQRVSLKVTGVTYPTCDLDVYISNPDGSPLLSDTCTVSNDLIGPTNLQFNGTYTILLDPQGSETGSATLQLYEFTDLSGTIAPNGASVTVTTSIPGQVARLTFTGTVSQRVSLKATGVTYPTCDLDVYISNPDGSPLTSDTCMVSNDLIEPVTLQSTETYTILIDPNGSATGSATLNLYDVPADVSGSIIINGVSFRTTIDTPGQNGAVTFSGTSGQQVTVRAAGNTFTTSPCLTLKLYRQDGTTQLTSRLGCGASFSLTQQTLPATETYLIKVDPGGSFTGSVDINVTAP